MNYKHLFFDLDRTLWDYDANSTQALTSLYDEYKLDAYYLTIKEFLTIYNRVNDKLWELYRNGGITKEKLRTERFDQTLKEKKIVSTKLSFEIGKRYMEITPKLNNLAPNTLDILGYLERKKYNLYILTNGFLNTQEKKMKYSDIAHYFLRIYSSEELGVNKPNKEIFHWAVSSIHAHKNDCLMIGDDINVDILGAMNYGIDGVWYNPNKESSDVKPRYEIENLMELTNYL